MSLYRITKYNPKYRDENGYYTLDEWIYFGQVGKVINGNKFTFQEYLKNENKYVESIKIILEELEINELRVLNLNTTNPFLNNSENLLGVENFNVKDLIEDKILTWELIETIIRANLREFIGCELFNKKIRINFGWDYYMYVLTDIELNLSIKKIEDIELFIEKFPEEKKDLKRRIILGNKVSEYLLKENIEISDVPVEKLKLLFGFSTEHPFDGSYELTEDKIDNIKSLINYNFLPDKFDYIIETYDANYE
jgi:hypothetical protein